MLGLVVDHTVEPPARLNVYTGGTKDPLRHSPLRLTDDAITEMTKTLLNEDSEDCSKVGLNPFCELNPPPDVSI